MPGQLELTDEEWALIGELLDRERSELPNGSITPVARSAAGIDEAAGDGGGPAGQDSQDGSRLSGFLAVRLPFADRLLGSWPLGIEP